MAIIEIHDVKKNYPLGKVEVQAVKGVSFLIEKGDFISIAGPSGSGKTTILNMIGLIDKPTAGEVIIDGKARFYLSIVQPDPCPERVGKHRVSPPPWENANHERRKKQLDRLAHGRSGAHGMEDPQTQRTFGRPTPEGGHCARPCDKAADSPGRRAHRQPRFRDRSSSS